MFETMAASVPKYYLLLTLVVVADVVVVVVVVVVENYRIFYDLNSKKQLMLTLMLKINYMFFQRN